MEQSPLENKSGQEKLEIRIGIAKPEDWQAYKELRLESITGEDGQMFGVTPEEVEKEKAKDDREWQADLLKDNIYFILSWSNSKAIGIGHFRKTEKEDVWSIGAAYVRPEFRGQGVGKKMYAMRLNEVKKRGGKVVQVGVNVINKKSIAMAEYFGFKSVGIVESKSRKWNELDLDLTDLDVIKKINEVLDAR